MAVKLAMNREADCYKPDDIAGRLQFIFAAKVDGFDAELGKLEVPERAHQVRHLPTQERRHEGSEAGKLGSLQRFELLRRYRQQSSGILPDYSVMVAGCRTKHRESCAAALREKAYISLEAPRRHRGRRRYEAHHRAVGGSGGSHGMIFGPARLANGPGCGKLERLPAIGGA